MISKGRAVGICLSMAYFAYIMQYMEYESAQENFVFSALITVLSVRRKKKSRNENVAPIRNR